MGDIFPGCCINIRFGQELTGNITLVSGVLEGGQDGFEIQVTRPGIPAIGIRQVEMEDPFTALANTFFDAGLFDVHVVGIQQ